MRFLREIVANNVFLYKLWFYGVRLHKGGQVRLPSFEDDFYFDGYPRSGNTFFGGLLKRVFPNRLFASHLHVIAGIKIALKLKLPVFVIIRKPKGAVLSNLYRILQNGKKSPDHALIERLLRSYCNYYLFVKKHIDNIYIINFDSSIHNELLMVRQVAKALRFKVESDDFLAESLASFQTIMEKKEEQKRTQVSSLPNPYRTKFKKEYEPKVLQISPLYDKAEVIYNELLKSENHIPRRES